MFDQIKGYILSGKNFKQCTPDISFADMVKSKFMPKNPTDEDYHFVQYIMNNTFGLPNGADPEKISAKLVNEYYKFRGEEHFVKGGYIQICEALTKCGFPINLKKEV
jgi:hypothetical protein